MKTSTLAADNKQSATIACDMTLFIRLMEVAREEINTLPCINWSNVALSNLQPVLNSDHGRLRYCHAQETSTLKSVLARLKKAA